MTYLDTSYVEAVVCDDRECSRQLPVAFLRAPHYDRPLCDLVLNAGWSIWIGRGSRHYCPDHGPKPGHRMREATR